MSQENEGSWLTVKDACQYLQVSQMTIFRWMKSGKLSYFKLGGSVRFKKENLDMTAEKITGEVESELSQQRCAICSNAELIAGNFVPGLNGHFVPNEKQEGDFKESKVQVEAKLCVACGHVQLFADMEKLRNN